MRTFLVILNALRNVQQGEEDASLPTTWLCDCVYGDQVTQLRKCHVVHTPQSVQQRSKRQGHLSSALITVQPKSSFLERSQPNYHSKKRPVEHFSASTVLYYRPQRKNSSGMFDSSLFQSELQSLTSASASSNFCNGSYTSNILHL
jgi:hypothetical protein